MVVRAMTPNQKPPRPWTDDDNERVREAASNVLRRWNHLADAMEEEDRVAFRELVCALDREDGDGAARGSAISSNGRSRKRTPSPNANTEHELGEFLGRCT